jgi:hypothetical protein
MLRARFCVRREILLMGTGARYKMISNLIQLIRPPSRAKLMITAQDSSSGGDIVGRRLPRTWQAEGGI